MFKDERLFRINTDMYKYKEQALDEYYNMLINLINFKETSMGDIISPEQHRTWADIKSYYKLVCNTIKKYIQVVDVALVKLDTKFNYKYSLKSLTAIINIFRNFMIESEDQALKSKVKNIIANLKLVENQSQMNMIDNKRTDIDEKNKLVIENLGKNRTGHSLLVINKPMYVLKELRKIIKRLGFVDVVCSIMTELGIMSEAVIGDIKSIITDIYALSFFSVSTTGNLASAYQTEKLINSDVLVVATSDINSNTQQSQIATLITKGIFGLIMNGLTQIFSSAYGDNAIAGVLFGGDGDPEKIKGGNPIFSLVDVPEKFYFIKNAVPFYVIGYNIINYYFIVYNTKKVGSELTLKISKYSPLYNIFHVLSGENAAFDYVKAENDDPNGPGNDKFRKAVNDALNNINYTVETMKVLITCLNKIWTSVDSADDNVKLQTSVSRLLSELNASLIFQDRFSLESLKYGDGSARSFIDMNISKLSNDIKNAMLMASTTTSASPYTAQQAFTKNINAIVDKVKEAKNDEVSALLTAIKKDSAASSITGTYYKFMECCVVPILLTEYTYKNIFSLFNINTYTSSTNMKSLTNKDFVDCGNELKKKIYEGEDIDLSANTEKQINGNKHKFVDYIREYNVRVSLLNYERATKGNTGSAPFKWWIVNDFLTYPNEHTNSLDKIVGSESLNAHLSLALIYPDLDPKEASMWDYFTKAVSEYISDAHHCLLTIASFPGVPAKYISILNDIYKEIGNMTGQFNDLHDILSKVHISVSKVPPPLKGSIPGDIYKTSQVNSLIISDNKQDGNVLGAKYNGADANKTIDNVSVPIDGTNMYVIDSGALNNIAGNNKQNVAMSDTEKQLLPFDDNWYSTWTFVDYCIYLIALCDVTNKKLPYKLLNAITSAYQLSEIIPIPNALRKTIEYKKVQQNVWACPITQSIIIRSSTDANKIQSSEITQLSETWISNLIGVIPYVCNLLQLLTKISNDPKDIRTYTTLNSIIANFYNSLAQFRPKVEFLNDVGMLKPFCHSLSECFSLSEQHILRIGGKIEWANKYCFGGNSSLTFPSYKLEQVFSQLYSYFGKDFTSTTVAGECLETTLAIIGKQTLMNSIIATNEGSDTGRNGPLLLGGAVTDDLVYKLHLVDDKYVISVLRSLINNSDDKPEPVTKLIKQSVGYLQVGQVSDTKGDFNYIEIKDKQCSIKDDKKRTFIASRILQSPYVIKHYNTLTNTMNIDVNNYASKDLYWSPFRSKYLINSYEDIANIPTPLYCEPGNVNVTYKLKYDNAKKDKIKEFVDAVNVNAKDKHVFKANGIIDIARYPHICDHIDNYTIYAKLTKNFTKADKNDVKYYDLHNILAMLNGTDEIKIVCRNIIRKCTFYQKLKDKTLKFLYEHDTFITNCIEYLKKLNTISKDNIIENFKNNDNIDTFSDIIINIVYDRNLTKFYTNYGINNDDKNVFIGGKPIDIDVFCGFITNDETDVKYKDICIKMLTDAMKFVKQILRLYLSYIYPIINATELINNTNVIDNNTQLKLDETYNIKINDNIMKIDNSFNFTIDADIKYYDNYGKLFDTISSNNNIFRINNMYEGDYKTKAIDEFNDNDYNNLDNTTTYIYILPFAMMLNINSDIYKKICSDFKDKSQVDDKYVQYGIYPINIFNEQFENREHERIYAYNKEAKELIDETKTISDTNNIVIIPESKIKASITYCSNLYYGIHKISGDTNDIKIDRKITINDKQQPEFETFYSVFCTNLNKTELNSINNDKFKDNLKSIDVNINDYNLVPDMLDSINRILFSNAPYNNIVKALSYKYEDKLHVFDKDNITHHNLMVDFINNRVMTWPETVKTLINCEYNPGYTNNSTGLYIININVDNAGADKNEVSIRTSFDLTLDKSTSDDIVNLLKEIKSRIEKFNNNDFKIDSIQSIMGGAKNFDYVPICNNYFNVGKLGFQSDSFDEVFKELYFTEGDVKFDGNTLFNRLYGIVEEKSAGIDMVATIFNIYGCEAVSISSISQQALVPGTLFYAAKFDTVINKFEVFINKLEEVIKQYNDGDKDKFNKRYYRITDVLKKLTALNGIYNDLNANNYDNVIKAIRDNDNKDRDKDIYHKGNKYSYIFDSIHSIDIMTKQESKNDSIDKDTQKLYGNFDIANIEFFKQAIHAYLNINYMVRFAELCRNLTYYSIDLDKNVPFDTNVLLTDFD